MTSKSKLKNQVKYYREQIISLNKIIEKNNKKLEEICKLNSIAQSFLLELAYKYVLQIEKSYNGKDLQELKSFCQNYLKPKT